MFLKAEFKREVERLAKAKREAALKRVAEATPVRTGRAKASWRIEGKAVVSDCSYMPELNHGTSAQAPSFFIEHAVLADSALHPNGVIVLNK